MFNILDAVARAEQFERDLESLEAAAHVRWLKFWRWLAVTCLCLGIFIAGLLVGKALP